MHSYAYRVALPIGATALGIAVAVVLQQLSDRGTFMVFLAMVTGSAVLGGVRVGLVTALLSIAAVDFFFLLPRGSMRVLAAADLVLLVVYGGTAVLFGWLTGRLTNERQRAQEKAARAAELTAFLERQLTESEKQADAVSMLHAAREARSPLQSRN